MKGNCNHRKAKQVYYRTYVHTFLAAQAYKDMKKHGIRSWKSIDNVYYCEVCETLLVRKEK